MKRVGFAMQLYPGQEAEYKKRHDQIWPDLAAELKDAGVYDYCIFLDKRTHTLFACHKLEDYNRNDKLAFTSIVKKWWDYMADIMETNPDNSPVVHDLEEMFYLA